MRSSIFLLHITYDFLPGPCVGGCSSLSMRDRLSMSNIVLACCALGLDFFSEVSGSKQGVYSIKAGNGRCVASSPNGHGANGANQPFVKRAHIITLDYSNPTESLVLLQGDMRPAFLLAKVNPIILLER